MTQANGAALAKSSASAAIVKAVHGHSNGDDGPERVCERGADSDQRASSSFSYVMVAFHSRYLFPLGFSSHPRLDRPIPRSWIDFGRNIVRARSVRTRPCLSAVASACLPPTLVLTPSLPNSRARYVATRYQCPCIVARCIRPALTCIDIRCCL